jgi:ribosomal protein L34
VASDVDNQPQRSSRRSKEPAAAGIGRAREEGLRQFEPVSDAEVLAAIERAERHSRHESAGMLRSMIAGHLGFAHAPWTTRRLRPQLESLVLQNLLARSRRHGVVMWAVTRKGRDSLARRRRAGESIELWESPQHREWLQARATASERIDGFREDVRRTLVQTRNLLKSEAPSDAWFDLADRLQKACWRLGSATYCLHEWREPDDAKADIDDHCHPGDQRLDRDERARARFLRSGRRGFWRWSDPDAGR